MLEQIKALRERPVEVRKRYTFLLSGSITAAIALLWVTTLVLNGFVDEKEIDANTATAYGSGEESERSGTSFRSQYGTTPTGSSEQRSPIERILSDLQEVKPPSVGYLGATPQSASGSPLVESKNEFSNTLYEEYLKATGRGSEETAPDGSPLPPLSMPDTL